MMSDCGWSLKRDSNQHNYKRKSYKRAFQQVDWPNLDYRGHLFYIGMKFQCYFAMYSSLFSDTQFINKR